jgi:hypothetical protein
MLVGLSTLRTILQVNTEVSCFLIPRIQHTKEYGMDIRNRWFLFVFSYSSYIALNINPLVLTPVHQPTYYSSPTIIRGLSGVSLAP